MEQCWAPVSEELRSGLLALPCLLSIATQVASALHYLHDRSIQHGAVDIANVYLADPPTAETATAKLTNFAQARRFHRDDEITADICGLGALAYNLFVKKRGDALSPQQLAKFGFGILELNIEFKVPEIGLLLQCIFTRRYTSSKEVAQKFADLQASYRRKVAALLEAPQPAPRVPSSESIFASQESAEPYS